MNKTHAVFDDLANLATHAMGAVRVATQEVKTAAQSRARDVAADMELASRDELDAVKALALAALERVDALEARLAALEAEK